MIRFAAEHLEPRRLMAAGDLDPSFGGVGAMDVELFHPLLGVQRVCPIADGTGDFLVIGLEIRRYKPNGALNTTFGGGDGIMPLPQAMVDSSDLLENAAVLPNGKVIADVRRIDAQVTYHQLVGFNADGSLAPTTLPITDGPIDKFFVQSDGKVVAIARAQVL